METSQLVNYVCRFCKGSFTQAQHLYKHVQQVHATNPSMKNSRTCPICGLIIAKYDEYRTHLRHLHGQRQEGQAFAFKCFNDFFVWKTELEKRTTCKYALQSAPKVVQPTNEKIHVYQCEPSVAMPLKNKTSRYSCPAMICAIENMKNREIKVEYWNTHFGHCVQTEEDELNAAINSVQELEHGSESSMEVMDILNSIDQSIDPGEVTITETIETESILLPKKAKKTIRRKKPSFVSSNTSTTPIVQNFSFKKDPSKKKESSIYSLASVACGKVSANKFNINQPVAKMTDIAQTPVNKTADKMNNLTNVFIQVAKNNSSLSKIILQPTVSENTKKALTTPLTDITGKTKETAFSSVSDSKAVKSMPLVNKNARKTIKPSSSLSKNSNNSSTIDSTSKSSVTVTNPIIISSLLSKDKTDDKIKNPLNVISETLVNDTLKHCDDISSMFKENEDNTNELFDEDWSSEEELANKKQEKELISVDSMKDKTNSSSNCFASKISSKYSPAKNKQNTPEKLTEKENISQFTGKKGVSVLKSSEKKLAPKPLIVDFPQPVIGLMSKQSNRSDVHKDSNLIPKISPVIQQKSGTVSVTSHLSKVASINTQSVNPQPQMLPIVPSYVSINGQLVPVLNAPPSVLPSSTNNITYSAVSINPITGKRNSSGVSNIIPLANGSNIRGLIPQVQPISTVIKSTNPVNLMAAKSSLQSSVPGTPLYLVPLSMNSAVSSTITPVSSIVSTPRTTYSKMNLHNKSVKRPDISTPLVRSVKVHVNRPITQFPAPGSKPSAAAKRKKSFLNDKPPPLVPLGGKTPTGVKVQKVSLPTQTYSKPTTTGTTVTFSKPNVSPVSASSSKSVSKIAPAGLQTGSYIFESAGDLYVLEPIDELALNKKCSPLTSTPKKEVQFSKFESSNKKKRKYQVENSSNLKSVPSKKLKTVKSTSKTKTNAAYNKANIISKINTKISEKHKTSLVTTKEIFTTKKSESVSKDTVNEEVSLSSDDDADECTNFSDGSEEIVDSNTVPDTQNKNSFTDTAKTVPPIQTDISIDDNKTSGVRDGSFLNKSTSFESKLYSALTTKTVPSLTIPQNRLVPSIFSSSKNSIFGTTSTYSMSSCISSATFSKDKLSEFNSNENTEVKKSVTIKSVAQEKRTDEDDLEVMKKVKYYKLEMKYLECQQQCKRLQVDLMKALSKNKELMEEVNNLKENARENIDSKQVETSEYSAVENGIKVIDDSKNEKMIGDNNTTNLDEKESDNHKEDSKEIGDDQEKHKDMKNETNDFDKLQKTIKEIDDKSKTEHADEEPSVEKDTENTIETIRDEKINKQSNIEPVGFIDSDNVIETIDDKENDEVSNEHINFEEVAETVNKSPPSKAECVVDNNVQNITETENETDPPKKDAKILKDNSNKNKRLSDTISMAQNDSEPENINFEFCEDLQPNIELNKGDDSDIQMFDVELNENSSTTDDGGVHKKLEEPLEKQKSDSEVTSELKNDVYTMVRTSVLRNLHSDLEELAAEKRRLLTVIDDYKMLFPSLVPINQEDS